MGYFLQKRKVRGKYFLPEKTQSWGDIPLSRRNQRKSISFKTGEVGQNLPPLEEEGTRGGGRLLPSSGDGRQDEQFVHQRREVAAKLTSRRRSYSKHTFLQEKVGTGGGDSPTNREIAFTTSAPVVGRPVPPPSNSWGD